MVLFDYSLGAERGLIKQKIERKCTNKTNYTTIDNTDLCFLCVSTFKSQKSGIRTLLGNYMSYKIHH